MLESIIILLLVLYYGSKAKLREKEMEEENHKQVPFYKGINVLESDTQRWRDPEWEIWSDKEATVFDESRHQGDKLKSGETAGRLEYEWRGSDIAGGVLGGEMNWI